MEGGPPGFSQSFTCSDLLGILLGLESISPTGLSPSMDALSNAFDYRFFLPCRSPATPYGKPHGLAWFSLLRVRSPLLAESLLISFPAGTEMFHFPACHLPHLFIQYGMTGHYSRRVSPFGYLRINARVQLPEAFRSLPRPSSSSDAKASFMCP